MSNYRRTSKPKTEHIKKGFTVFQKTIATIGSILGLITATITIMNAMDNNKNNKKEPTTTQTTVVKEIQKESPQENTTPNRDNTSTKENTTQKKLLNPIKKRRKKKSRKQQLRILLHLPQQKKQAIMEHSQIRRVLKLKRTSNHQNSFFPNLERSYFLLLQYFSWFGSLSWTDDTCHFEFFHKAGRTIKSN